MITPQEQLEILQAFLSGKTVQANYGDGWTKLTTPKHTFNFDDIEYRIKPSEPEYRPWKFEEVKIGTVIKTKIHPDLMLYENELMIVRKWRDADSEIVCLAGYTHKNHTLKDIFDKYTLLDGSPCGVLED